MFFDNKDSRYLVLDIEGNSARQEEERKMTQLSALIIQNEEIQEVNMFNRNVNYISPFVRKLTHISIKKCKVNGYSERHLINEAHKLISSCEIVYAYGCDFDKSILKYMFNKYNLEWPETKWIDVINPVKKYLNPSKAKLNIAATEYGFETDSHYHNALVDCYATLFLMNKIEEKVKEEN